MLSLVEAEGGKMALLARMKDMEENDKAGFLEIQTLNAVIKTQDGHIRDITHKLVYCFLTSVLIVSGTFSK